MRALADLAMSALAAVLILLGNALGLSIGDE
jgi:hypothetical protein